MAKTESGWNIDDAAALYGVRDWGAGYFDLSENGDVSVKLNFPTGEVSVSLMDIVSGIRQRGHEMPVLLRIENLLDARIAQLNEAFRSAISRAGYQGQYRGVFPVKVNQQAQVIEEIVAFGSRYGHGLEAGSKPEMVLALAALHEDGLLVLNGYKDREFIDLGLWAIKLGYRCFFVIESLAELPLILERSEALGVRPLIGARIKVTAKVGGLWTETSGDRSSFGLSSTQLISVVDSLKARGYLDCLQLLHCHLGSQIPNIQDIRAGVQEAARYYADLVGEGVPLAYLDLGGGLAVDYVGCRTSHVHSRNYNLDEYCGDIVETVMEVLDSQGIAHPHLVTESGRATVAYSSMLFFDVLDVARFEAEPLPSALHESVHEKLRALFSLLQSLDATDLQQSYNDAIFYRDEIRDLFKRGQLSLRERSLGENLFLAVAQAIASRLEGKSDIPPGLEGLRESLADIYYGNFSVFQSLPDTWAIGQLFPVVPLHRHLERPTREGIISDLTCDCDGKLDNFIVGPHERKTLPLHPLKDGEDYLLGVFLMGAYQETLGDLHNLFGDTHVVSVRINADGGFDVMKEISGDSIADVLSYVEYNPDTLFDGFRKTCEDAVRRGKISVAERQQILEDFSARLRGYTYYKK